MSMPPPKLVYLVERAAELRAAGNSWEQVAHKLDKPLKSVRNWRQRYRAFWDQAIAVARREIAADASDEGLAILRQLARSDDEKIRREASTRLVELRPEIGEQSAGPSDLVRFVEFLESLSDDQLDSFLGVDIRVDDARPANARFESPNPAISA